MRCAKRMQRRFAQRRVAQPEARKKRFPFGNPRVPADTNLRSPAKNKAVSGVFSEQDGSASGFAWVAREP
jgi:hypothetical protein